MILTGYYIESTDGVIVEELLAEMRSRMIERATAAYKKLLEHEIQMMVDGIALNQIQSQNIPILEASENLLLARTRFASINQTQTPYNFNASAHIFIYDGKTYIRINSNNNIYQKTIKSIDGLIGCHVTDGSNENAEIWTNIMKKYSGATPPRYVQLVEWEKPSIDYKELHFEKPALRARTQVRYNVQSRLVNMLANNEQVPANRLMELIDQAIEIMTSDQELKLEMKKMESQLVATLPNITLKMIEMDPKGEVKGEEGRE